MKIVLLGKQKDSELKILKESEKALQIEITEVVSHLEDLTETRTAWLPKSQVKVINEKYILVPKWLVWKHDIPTIYIRCKLNNLELAEIGLDINNLSLEDYIVLLEKGQAEIAE